MKMPPFGSLQGRLGGRSVPKRVEYIADSLGTGTTTTNQQVAIPAHFDGDLILAVCGSTTSTVPTLPTGWTNAILAVNTGSAQVRPMRMFYIISDGTLTTLDITTVTTVGLRASGCMIFRNAVSVGAAAAYTSTVVDALTRPFSALALQNTDGTSVVVGATHTQLITSIVAGSVSMTLGTVVGTTAIFARSNNVEAFAATNWNASTSAARISATVEVRGPILTKVWSALDGTKTLVNDNDVSSWGGPIAFPQSVTANRPAYDPMTDLVTFTRTSGHFLNAGSQTLNIGTNGGFTAVFHFKYFGTGAVGERIFEFGSGAPNNNVLVHRLNPTSTNTLSLYITNGTTAVVNNLQTAANVVVQNQLAVWAVRYRANDLSAMIFKNEVLVANGEATALVTDRTVTSSIVGRPVTGWASPLDINGSIQGLYVYDRALADEEITNLSVDRFGANFGAVRGFSLQRLFTTYAGPVVRVRRSSDSYEQAFWADTLSGTLLSSALAKRFTDLDTSSRVLVGSEVSSWGSPIAFVGTTGTRPDYVSADDVVRFSRANSDYLNAGTQSFPISTNGGFTAVVMVRFSGTLGSWERVFDWSSTGGVDGIFLNRNQSTSTLQFAISNGATSIIDLRAPGAIVQNELALVVVRYRKSDNSAQIYKNNELIASVTGLTAVTDRTVTSTYIGRSYSASNAYFNGDIRGLYVYSYALTDTELQSVILSKFGMPGVSGPEYDAFIGSGTGYVSQLMDQTGQGYHATQVTTASQPWIVKNASWTSQPTMRCGGVGWLGYNGATNAIVNTNYTVAVTTARTSSATFNFCLAGTSATTNQNLVLGYRTNTSFTHDQFGNGYDMTIPAYSVPTSETFVVRHSSTLAKNAYKNGTLLGSGASAVALGAYAGAQIGRYQTATPYYGDVSSLIMFDSYLRDFRRQIVEADLAGLLGSPVTYGPLDLISSGAKATCVAAYSLRQATATYTGAIVRLRRPSDSFEADFTAAQFDSGAVATWAGAETPTVVTLMDQSGGGNHLTQSTVANQPSLLVSDRAVRFDQTTVSKTLSKTWNVFGASTLTQMHMVSATRENSRGTNELLKFEQSGGTIFRTTAPWSDGIWYVDIGNSGAATGRAASNVATTLGATTVLSAYKNPSGSLTGFRLNGDNTFTSTGSTSTMTVTGVTLGGTTVGASQDVFEWMIFNAKLPVPDEIALEIDLQRF